VREALERLRSAALGGAVGELMSAARRRLLVVLMLLLALDYADRSVLGALAPELKHAFHVGNAAIGVVAAAFSVVAGLATLPSGILADRIHRMRLLAASAALWSLAMGASGAALVFTMLLASQLALGAVTATARPTIVSLAGDAFPESSRARALAIIDSGELVGSGLGLLVAGILAGLVTWRGVFWLFALAGVGTAVASWLTPEPARTERRRRGKRDAAAGAAPAEADNRLVLGREPELSLWQAVVYTLRVRTNVIVIVSVAIGYFFFAGIRTFAVIFIHEAYGISRAAADLSLLALGVGALFGVLVGGRIGDALIRAGRPDGRLLVASYSYLLAGALLLPALLVHDLLYASPFLLLGGAALAAPAAPLDAVRIDVIHPRFRGRAEGVRNVVLICAEAGGPLLFGLLADRIGLRATFLGGLAPLAAGALVLQLGRRFYAREAAAANAEA
jgi:predicted MFS family arabinose efflux permease